MRISIIGAGYVGLVSGACLADRGHDVVVVDKDPRRVASIDDGSAPFYEPGLDDVLGRVAGRKLQATDDLSAAITATDVTLIAVGTPSEPDGRVDLGAIRAVAMEIGDVLAGKDDWHAVIVKSTVPPGTTERVVGDIVERHSGKPRGSGFGLGMNPEFLTEGTAVRDFMEPDRLVFGAADPQTMDVQRRMYVAFGGVTVHEVGNSTAEMIKYMSNALLATMISFANEFADLCAAIGDIDAHEVQKGVHSSRYLTPDAEGSGRPAPVASFLEAGCGFGGSCLPKDVKGLAALARELGINPRILDAVLEINAERPGRLLGLVRGALGGLEDRTIAVLGLAFRPDTSDIRESPAIPLIEGLLAANAAVRAYDPQAMTEMQSIFDCGRVDYCDSLKGCVTGADAVIIVTRWAEFLRLPDILDEAGTDTPVIDGRRMLRASRIRNYHGIGLPEATR